MLWIGWVRTWQLKQMTNYTDQSYDSPSIGVATIWETFLNKGLIDNLVEICACFRMPTVFVTLCVYVLNIDVFICAGLFSNALRDNCQNCRVMDVLCLTTPLLGPVAWQPAVFSFFHNLKKHELWPSLTIYYIVHCIVSLPMCSLY